MKRHRLAWLLLSAAMLLSGCASASLSMADETAETKTAAPAGTPVFSAKVTLTGEGRADSTIRAKIETDAKGKQDVRWYLDGQELKTRGEVLQIPYSAADKDLVCRVTCEGYEGFAESEPLTVLERGENASVTCAGLWEDVKWFNRTEPVGTGMAADWSCSGFEMNLWAAGGEFRVYYQADYKCYFAFFVDGEQTARPLLSGDDSFAVEIPAGNHTVKLMKDTEIQSSGAGVTLKSVVFDGDILEKPADKNLYFQVVGASSSCGDGALGVYTAGQKWKLADHAGTCGFPYYAAEILDADFEIVSKGGIGVIKASGKYNSGEIYDYVNRFRSNTGVDYSTARKPDVIIINLGGNDYSVSTVDEYTLAVSALVKQFRARWGGEIKIVWFGSYASQYEAVKNLFAAMKSDPNLYAIRYSVEGKGSAALETQTSGHPNAEEQRGMAETLVAFMRENGIV